MLLLPNRREELSRWINDGYQLFFVSNQSGIAAGRVTHQMGQQACDCTATLLGLPVTEITYCPHPHQPVDILTQADARAGCLSDAASPARA